VIDGKEYDECAFCRASCPSRDIFKEPDSGLPLKCDMCEGEDEPLCVKWCLVDALVLEEREEEVEEEEALDEMELGLESLADKYGMGRSARPWTAWPCRKKARTRLKLTAAAKRRGISGNL
jgi:benzoyl-CoA reductase subunit BamC